MSPTVTISSAEYQALCGLVYAAQTVNYPAMFAMDGYGVARINQELDRIAAIVPQKEKAA